LKILNITADYPDVIQPSKTQAVKLLLEASVHEHFIVSINRCSSPYRETIVEFDRGVAISYYAPPGGVGLRFFIARLTSRILKYIKLEMLSFDFIIAHKLAVEGLIVNSLAKSTNKKYAVSLWGSTDKKFLSLKPELTSTYKSIYANASLIYPASPWVRRYVEERLNECNSSVVMLPIVTNNTSRKFPTSTAINFVTVFNLDLYKLKGLPVLLEALAEYGTGWTFDIYGVGSDRSIQEIKILIIKLEMQDRVTLKGRVDNSEITEVLSGYHSFLMPTRSETFGMVYIEAIFSGIPILYSLNQGVDGYFDSLNVGVKVIAGKKLSIYNGLVNLVRKRDVFVDDIAKYHEDGAFKFFKKDSIVKIFDNSITSAGDT
jgi:hypothetical protein